MIEFFGIQYNVPVVENLSGTVVAINVGGAVIPTIMSLHLLVSRSLWVPGAIAIAIVAVVLHWLANPVPGVGIAVPVFIPAVVTAVVSLLLSRINTALLAYISGSMGTLIGADLTNLDKVQDLGAPTTLRDHDRHQSQGRCGKTDPYEADPRGKSEILQAALSQFFHTATKPIAHKSHMILKTR